MPLLSPTDPPAVTVTNPNGSSVALLVSDHQSNLVPASLGTLGVEPRHFDLHVGYDIGIAMVADHLVRLMDAPLVASGFSRLVIDCNRFPDTPGAMPVVSDGIEVPANRHLSVADREARVTEIFAPYHDAIEDRIAAMRKDGRPPVFVALHSFTPVMAEKFRPWQIGILWNEDERVARPLIEALRSKEGINVGDNEPYSARSPLGFTTAHHAEPRNLPHVAVEFRQDLIADPAGAQYWAEVFHEALDAVLKDAPWENSEAAQ